LRECHRAAERSRNGVDSTSRQISPEESTSTIRRSRRSRALRSGQGSTNRTGLGDNGSGKRAGNQDTRQGSADEEIFVLNSSDTGFSSADVERYFRSRSAIRLRCDGMINSLNLTAFERSRRAADASRDIIWQGNCHVADQRSCSSTFGTTLPYCVSQFQLNTQ
jgi:hypothetical protein